MVIYMYFSGDRGLLYETWSSTFIRDYSEASVSSLLTNASDYSSRVVDSAFIAKDTVEFLPWSTVRIRGYFTAPHTGYFIFTLRSSEAILYLSNTSLQQDLVSIRLSFYS